MPDREDQDRSRDVARAVEVLRGGGLVAFPTETVYGLGADATNVAAVSRIFAVKGRPSGHPLIVHIPEASFLPRYARDVPEPAWRLAARYWPGPLTVVLRRAPSIPNVVTGGQETVGLRVPAHPLALDLLRAFGGGVAAPSANRFGGVSPTTADHVRADLGPAVDFVLDGGPCAVGIESTIVDLSGPEPLLLRPGQVTAAELAAVLGRPVRPAGSDGPRAPGRLRGHYAPRTPVRLVEAEALDTLAVSRAGRSAAVLARRAAPPGALVAAWLAASPDPAGYARGLYAALRQLDALGCAVILVEQVPAGETWAAVRDRLERAASGAAGGAEGP